MDGLRFREWETPLGVAGSALFDTGPMVGIYVLVFGNGEEYVGQSVDFLRRFADHRRRWGDIVRVRFAPVLPEELDRAERSVIAERVHDGIPLRNRTLLSQPLGSSPLDMIIDRQDQAEWLRSGTEPLSVASLLDRGEQAQRRIRAHERLARLLAHPSAESVVTALAAYVAHVVPAPDETEGRLWTVTALPSTVRTRTNRRLATLSIQNVEMLFLGESREESGEWEPYTVLNTAVMDPLSQELEELFVVNRHYRSAGPVHSADLWGHDALPGLLAVPEVMAAARSLALGQMRKGRAAFSRFHNEALADEIFACIGRNTDPEKIS